MNLAQWFPPITPALEMEMGGSGVQGRLSSIEAVLGYMKIMGEKFLKKPPPGVKVYTNLHLKMDPKRLGSNSCFLFIKIPTQVGTQRPTLTLLYIHTPYSSTRTFWDIQKATVR